MKKSWIWNWTWNGIPIPIALGGFAIIIIFFLVFQFLKPIRELKPYDPSVMTENTAIFFFDKNFSVRKVNEKKINWWTGFSKAAYINLPHGEYTFLVNFYDGKRSAKDLSVSEQLDKGKIYMLSYSIDQKENRIQYSINEISKDTFEKLKSN